jgi:hypothetical protein
MHVNSRRGEMFRECGSDFRSSVLGRHLDSTLKAIAALHNLRIDLRDKP